MRAGGCLGVLAAVQFLLLLVAGLAAVGGQSIGWGWILSPVLVLGGISVAFWALFLTAWAKFGK
jgi:hypothetical protein